MAINLVELANAYMRSSVIRNTSVRVKESQEGVQNAINAYLPVVLGGLVQKMNTPGLVDTLKELYRNGILNGIGSRNITANPVTQDLLKNIFGDKLNGLVSSVAQFAGIKNEASESLLHMTSDAAFGTVGKQINDFRFTAGNLTDMLSDQKNLLGAYIPAGFSLAPLGLDSGLLSLLESKTKESKPLSASVAAGFKKGSEKSKKSGWGWLLTLVVLALAAFFIWKQCNKTSTSEEVVTETEEITTENTDNASGKEVVGDIEGVEITGFKNGMEDRMIQFLKSGGYDQAVNDEALKDGWYDFDGVNFKMGSPSELEAGSEDQLQNLVTILQAFPDAKIKIGGYTDKTGDENVNLNISQARADFIKQWLSDHGVAAQVTSAEGYGSKFATVDASASNEERAKDRKMSVRFTK